MNTPTRIALTVCSTGSIVALLALATLLAVGLDSSYTTLLGLIILGGGFATIATVAATIALATIADRRAPWRVGAPEPYRYRLHVIRDAIEAPSYELGTGS